MNAKAIVDNLLENVDEPVADISGYIEDVLPFSASARDIDTAFSIRGFILREAEGRPKSWYKTFTPQDNKVWVVKQTGDRFIFEMWPQPSGSLPPYQHDHWEFVKHVGSLRSVLRMIDRLSIQDFPDRQRRGSTKGR